MAVPKFVGENAIWKNIFSERSIRKGSTQELLSRVPAFAHLTFRELKEVSAIIHRREYRAGEPVFYQGDPGLGMYIIQEGSVSIVIAEPDGEQKDLAVLSEGDFFGELGLLDESPRSAGAVCKTDCLLIGFFRPDLLDLIERKPSLGIKIVIKLAEIVGERLRKTDKELSKLKTQMDALQAELERRSNGEKADKDSKSVRKAGA
ncbi:MAG TPA: cyclic nucleotide-binding domain-containing protein [Bacteroidota bacterium]